MGVRACHGPPDTSWRPVPGLRTISTMIATTGMSEAH